MKQGYAIFIYTIAFVCISEYWYTVYASSTNWILSNNHIHDLAFNVKYFRFAFSNSNREHTLELQIKWSFAIFAIIIRWGILIILKIYTSHMSFILI